MDLMGSDSSKQKGLAEKDRILNAIENLRDRVVTYEALGNATSGETVLSVSEAKDFVLNDNINRLKGFLKDYRDIREDYFLYQSIAEAGTAEELNALHMPIGSPNIIALKDKLVDFYTKTEKGFQDDSKKKIREHAVYEKMVAAKNSEELEKIKGSADGQAVDLEGNQMKLKGLLMKAFLDKAQLSQMNLLIEELKKDEGVRDLSDLKDAEGQPLTGVVQELRQKFVEILGKVISADQKEQLSQMNLLVAEFGKAEGVRDISALKDAEGNPIKLTDNALVLQQKFVDILGKVISAEQKEQLSQMNLLVAELGKDEGVRDISALKDAEGNPIKLTDNALVLQQKLVSYNNAWAIFQALVQAMDHGKLVGEDGEKKGVIKDLLSVKSSNGNGALEGEHLKLQKLLIDLVGVNRIIATLKAGVKDEKIKDKGVTRQAIAAMVSINDKGEDSPLEDFSLEFKKYIDIMLAPEPVAIQPPAPELKAPEQKGE